MTTDSPRILLVRLSAIGDVIHGLPVLNALRRHWPNAHLGWVVEKTASPLVQNHPALNWCRVVPRGWLKSLSTVRQLRRDLRNEAFDIAIDMQGLTKSAIAAWLSGAKRRIGFGGAEGREISTWLNTETVLSKSSHVVDKNLELLSPLQVTDLSVTFELPVFPEEAAKATQALRDTGIEHGYSVINPGAGWPSKRWPLDRYAAVARYLYEEKGLKSVVVWAGEEENAWAQQIVKESAGSAVLAPPTSLTALAAFLKPATMFVGSDTGPLHIAVAVGTPSIGLFGPMPSERNGPYGAKHIALQKQWIHGTSRERRNASTEAMEAISVPDVQAACDRLLEGQASC